MTKNSSSSVRSFHLKNDDILNFVSIIDIFSQFGIRSFYMLQGGATLDLKNMNIDPVLISRLGINIQAGPDGQYPAAQMKKILGLQPEFEDEF